MILTNPTGHPSIRYIFHLFLVTGSTLYHPPQGRVLFSFVANRSTRLSVVSWGVLKQQQQQQQQQPQRQRRQRQRQQQQEIQREIQLQTQKQ